MREVKVKICKKYKADYKKSICWLFRFRCMRLAKSDQFFRRINYEMLFKLNREKHYCSDWILEYDLRIILNHLNISFC